MKRLKVAFVVLLCGSLAAGVLLRHVLVEKRVDERLYLSEVVPGVTFSEKAGTPPHYVSGEGMVAFNTYDVVPSIRGYAGPIKLLIALRPDGVVTGLRILEHQETKNFVHYMERPEYLGQYLGKSVHDPFRVDGDIDAISAATVSVEALARTVRDSTRSVAREVYGIEVREEAGVRKRGTSWMVYLALFLAALGAYGLSRKDRRLLRARDVFLIVSVFLLGFYLSIPFSILHVFNLLLRGLPSDPLSLALVGSVAFSLVVAGRFYCGWLCPFGAVIEFAGRVPLAKWQVAVGFDDRWRNLKYLFLAVVVVLVLLTGRSHLANYETYVTLFSFHGNVLTWGLVALMVLLSVRVPRFWCRYLCPVAALTGLLARQDHRYVSRHDCPVGNKASPLTSECIRCNRCYRP
jgi:Na+-translocating ferredoxin:NAD+ oxidoreductase RnfG subunit